MFFILYFTWLALFLQNNKTKHPNNTEMEKVDTRKRYDLDRITRLIITIICIVAAIMTINYLSGILLPFVIGGVLAYMLNPFVEWIKKVLHLKGRAFASILAIIITVAVITLVLWWLIPYIANEVSSMTKMLTNYAKASFKIPHIPAAVHEFFRQNIDLTQWQKLLTKEQWMNLLNSVASGTWSVLGGTMSVILSLITLLLCICFSSCLTMTKSHVASRVLSHPVTAT